ncbi:MAG TPA: mycofactocin biosynthesis peptidyl-dipeptidase MftE [Acidimicrobiales bacterium]|nr:mycofactocin biosynthesis peptidyl-dipeptidase MftE [Acidimicrobiales bacterium]
MPVKRLAEMPWPEVDAGAGGWVLAVPLGATEQHGPHLPVGTDTLVAEAVAAGLGSRRPDVVVAPPLPFGASGEHAGFPGTLSLGRAGLETAVVELVRSADAFRGLVLVSGHGGNAEALDRAASLCTSEGRAVLTWGPPRAVTESVTGPLPADAHAGRVETSLLLHLAPDLVGAPAPGATTAAPLRELMPALRRSGVAGVSPTGVLGDPAGASAAEGRALLVALVDDLVGAVDRWCRVG